MSLRVLLVNAPSQDCCDRFFGWPTSLLYAVAPSFAAAQEGRLDVEFLPAVFDPLWWVDGQNDHAVASAFRASLSSGVDVVCISTTYDSLYPALKLLELAKRHDPAIVTILGGPHFDEIHHVNQIDDHRRKPSVVDWVVAGDGEYALFRILEVLSSGAALAPESISGKAWVYHRGHAYESSGTPVAVDDLPFIPLEIADSERHRHDFDIFVDGSGIIPTAQMIAKRGCAYTCDYCSERRQLAYPNSRAIDRILQEIEIRKSQGFRAIFFDDSTFGLFPRLQELLAALRGSGMVFGCLNRFNHLTRPEVVGAYHDAGFRYMYCAIEQFDDVTLRSVGKAQTTNSIQRAMALLDDYGIDVGVSLLYGLPGESARSINATLDYTGEWVEKGRIRLVSESVLSFHPGTPAATGQKVRFDRTPPNRGFPFNRFEEGQWYHPTHVTAGYLEWLLRESHERFGHVLVRERHSWHRRRGLVIVPESAQVDPAWAGTADEGRTPCAQANESGSIAATAPY